MLNTVSDLLEELKSKGVELIKKNEIVDHPVLIGDMYEGLTQELLSNAIFDGLNLRIVGGKIRNSKGAISGEIDCMLVEGEGEKLPFADKYIYHYSHVIAVIEVKKKLYSNSISDSYSNLRKVIDVSIEPEKDGDTYIMRSLRDAWRSMLNTELPKRCDLHLYNETEQQIYHTLLMEAYFPLRIVFGYFGLKTEYSLREAFAKFLGSKANPAPAKGYGVGSIPNLIICGKNSIIKNNGMPFAMPFSKEEFYWPILVTSRENPLHHLLEVVWTRLSYKYNISSSIFGFDSNYEPAHKYINCKLGHGSDGNLGWMYNYSVFTESALCRSNMEPVSWKPVFLTQKQFEVIEYLCQHDFLNYIDNTIFTNLITDDGADLLELIHTLLDTGLIYDRNNEIRLLTDECAIVCLPDGSYCAGENKNGELTLWVETYIESLKNNTI